MNILGSFFFCSFTFTSSMLAKLIFLFFSSIGVDVDVVDGSRSLVVGGGGEERGMEWVDR